ncbi:MAG: alcohol dehydrogenase catalytic domain-containing protein [Chloroflexia bacterium]|nr:alcohol dehydrogenase catalytic domain-containing protein [Chloroflexia bacterium]
MAIRTFGDPDALSVIDLPMPEPGNRQVRIRVQAATVNAADIFVRSGAMASILPAREHYVLGWDVAGTVDAVGSAVVDFIAGDAVVGLSDWLRTQVGTHAEYVVLDAGALAPAPAGVSPIEAATLPANGLAAA